MEGHERFMRNRRNIATDLFGGIWVGPQKAAEATGVTERGLACRVGQRRLLERGPREQRRGKFQETFRPLCVVIYEVLSSRGMRFFQAMLLD